MYTTASALLAALAEAGVSFLFANFGSDHPALIEALAEAAATGRPLPAIVTCPNEMVALSAAHGAALLTGRAQAVLVHVDCGTQALAGAVHNAARGRAPVLIVAGLSPATQEGELRGSRNEFIHWLQDVPDQRGILRGYVKYENELRSGRNARQIIHRALQIAESDPKGPVYLTAAREVLEEELPPAIPGAARFEPISPAALAEPDLDALATALLAAERPLVVTSYLGRNPAAVPALVALARNLGAGVLESVPSAMNFPTDDPAWQGVYWNEQRQDPILAEADLVLVIESDVPWIPTVNRPAAEARIYHIDVDPLKERFPLWHIPARRSFRADAATALAQLDRRLAARPPDLSRLAARRARLARRHAERAAVIAERARRPTDEITPEFAIAALRPYIDSETIILNEAISSYTLVNEHIGPLSPGSSFASGAGSLGWHGGAAIGAKLARPEKTVVAVAGDGSYLFSIPSTVHWMARQYRTPFLTIVLNNRGWKSPKLSTLAVHPSGYASRANDLGVSFDPPPDYAAIAAASGGAFAATVRHADEMDAALACAFRAVRQENRAAVIDIWLARL
ncbi:MAG TPA: thiamine pyrophosphate-requiring protein [Acetobacteraceae bacterium]|nr:thiamine pyrophosphate-requiring protein [Acetobacteraceae bacterium]